MVNDATTDEAAQDEVVSVQPDRYFESEDHVPDPTSQYGVVLTRGAINTNEVLDFATPMLRDHRIKLTGDEPTQDEYFLTEGQREAAVDENAAADDGDGPVVDDVPENETDQAAQPEPVAPDGAVVEETPAP
jgi:hypothetical protein